MTIHILAFDTSTDLCSVALLSGNEIISQDLRCHNQHAAKLLGMIEKLLSEAALSLSQLDAITFGNGPGSFTGIRIAISVAQGLGFGIARPLIPISTLHIIAQAAYQQHRVERVLAVIDARMEQIYCGTYHLDKNALMQPHGELSLVEPEKIPDRHDYFGAGNAWQIYSAKLSSVTHIPSEQVDANIAPYASAALPLAKAIFLQGGAISASEALPIYLRDKVTF